MPIQYFVMDGRASYDVDEASVMEAFTAKNHAKAKAYFKREYADMDAVLVDKDMEIIHVD